MSDILATFTASIAGLSAFFTAVFGVVLVLRELRNRDRKALLAVVSELRKKLATSRNNEIILLEYAHTIRKVLVANGMDHPDHPELDIPPERKSIDIEIGD